MPIYYSMRKLPVVPAVYDIRRDLAERDRKWFGKGNMYLYPSKRDFKGTKMRFRVNEIFNEMTPRFIGVPEHIHDFRFGRESNTAVFALSPEMVRTFADTTLLDTIVYRMLGRTIIVVKKIMITKRAYDGSSLRRFNVKGMKTVRGFASSKKYNRAMLAAIINAYGMHNNLSGFADKVSMIAPVPSEDGMKSEIVAAAFDPALFRKIDKITSGIKVLSRFIRTAELSFMYVLKDVPKQLPAPAENRTRTLVIPMFRPGMMGMGMMGGGSLNLLGHRR